MPEEITRVDYYIGAIPNKVGEGAKLLNALKDAGVNLTACLAYRKTARNAEVVVAVAENAPTPARAAKKADVTLGKKQKALLVTGEDRVGALSETLDKLAAAGINVVASHAVAAGAGRYGALIALEARDLKKAAKALGI